MWRNSFFSVFLVILVASTQAETANERELQGRVIDRFFPGNDKCENSPGVYGVCVQSRFPRCQDGTLICYNRKPMRNKFHKDNRQPYFYIDYDNVFCYPDQWSGCSSCAPGRYCLSESRCILENIGYPCEQWY